MNIRLFATECPGGLICHHGIFDVVGWNHKTPKLLSVPFLKVVDTFVEGDGRNGRFAICVS